MRKGKGKDAKWVWLIAHALGLVVVLTTVLCYVYLKRDASEAYTLQIDWQGPIFQFVNRVVHFSFL